MPNRPAFSPGLDHFFANPPGHANLHHDVVDGFRDLFAEDDVYNYIGLTELHRIVLGMTNTSLSDLPVFNLDEIDMQDAEGRTPLMWAARRGDLASLKTLIDCGANVNLADITMTMPLHKAAADADDESVSMLLEAGALADAADDLGATPLHMIFFSPHVRTATIEALLAYGANVNARTDMGQTAAFWAGVRKYPTDIENLRSLIRHGIDLAAVDNHGDTVAMDSVCASDAILLQEFLDAGVRVDGSRKNGTTILHLAAWYGTEEILQILVRAAMFGRLAGVNIDAKHEGHDLDECFEVCRAKRFVRNKGTTEVARALFKQLVGAAQEWKRNSILKTTTTV